MGCQRQEVSKEQVIRALCLGHFLFNENPGVAHRGIQSHGSHLLDQQGKGYISGNTAAQQRHNCY